ncbi:MAG: hypothetical protein L6Q72_20005 [Burkholderiaceae bacterium]|nr:hypothetical protein [Burkholderiaceae bacterium]
MAICLTADAALNSTPLCKARERNRWADLARVVSRNFPRGLAMLCAPLTDLWV